MVAQAEEKSESIIEKANRLERQAGSPIPVSSMVLLDRRDDIPPDIFYAYWRDVHGVLVAQLPLEEIDRHYWQYHLASADTALWPKTDGLSAVVPAVEAVEGIAMATFNYGAYAAATVFSKERVKTISAQIMQDEKNIFKGIYAFMALGENIVELVNKRKRKTYQGDGGEYRVMVLLRKKEGLGQQVFQSFVREKIADNLAKEERANDVKLHFWENQQLTAEESPDVDNLLPAGKNYHGALELGYSDYETARSALNARAMAVALSSQSDFLGAVAAYPIKSAYTLSYHGKPTLNWVERVPCCKSHQCCWRGKPKTARCARKYLWLGHQTAETAISNLD